MLKIVSVTVVPAFYRSPGVEVEPGDEATLFLNQSRNSDFPVSIPGTILAISDTISHSGGCGQNAKTYVVQYDNDDLPVTVSELAACDVTTVSGTSCCESLRSDLDDLVTEVEAISADLDTWDEFTLTGQPTDGSPGVAQVETQTAVGTVATDGTLIATVTGVGITGSPLAIPFPVIAGDVPSVWAAKAAAALDANAAVFALYDASNIGTSFGLTEKVPNGNDGTLNIAVANGTATGITNDPTSDNMIAGVAAVTPSPVPARVGQHARWGTRIWEATSLYAWTELLTEHNGIVDYGFTAPLGSTPTSLDSLPVDSTMAGQDTVIIGGSGIYFYGLDAGTAAENSPLVVRPDNYAGGTNEFVWNLKPAVTVSAAILDTSEGGFGDADETRVPRFGAGGTFTITDILQIRDSFTGFTLSLYTPGAITAARAHQAANADGTLALQQTPVATTPLTGATINVARYTDQSHYITPAGTIATMTFTLPTAANSRVGQVVKLWFTQIVTTLTVNVSGGGTILGSALVAAVVNTPYQYECVSVAGAGTWTRRQ